MSEYNRQFSNKEKEKKITKFNNIYYNYRNRNWKVDRLPNWMEFYGYNLDKELNNKLPKYYRVFRQGTVVMMDYGIRIGSEMSGLHFGVILNSNDSKYKRTVITVPLSSHEQRDYLDLGYQMFQSAIDVINQREKEMENLIKYLQSTVKKSPKNKAIKLRIETINYLQSNNIDTSIMKKDIKFDILKGDNELECWINLVKKLNNYKKFTDLKEFIDILDNYIKTQHNVVNKINSIRKSLKDFQKLQNEIYKYNKRTYAAVNDIGVVSKLRVTKIGNYTLSGNIKFPKEAIAAILLKLNKIFDIKE